MGTGAANQVQQLLGRNPASLTQAEWEAVALSGEGIYNPMLDTYGQFKGVGMLGPTFRIDGNGQGTITGDVGFAEISIMRMLERVPAVFERRTGKEFEEIPSTSLGGSRGEVIDSLNKMVNSGAVPKTRSNDYVLVASGALKPWAKQLDEQVISGIESRNFSNKPAIINTVRDIFNSNPLLKTVVSNKWNNRVRNGNMDRAEADRLIERYL